MRSFAHMLKMVKRLVPVPYKKQNRDTR